MPDRIPWQLYALAGVAIIVAGAVIAYIYSARAVGGGVVAGGSIPLGVARRKMARAKRLREEADARRREADALESEPEPERTPSQIEAESRVDERWAE